MICPSESKMKRNVYATALLAVLSMALLLPADLMSQVAGKKRGLDEQVRTFLEKRSGTWRDLNIPASDGRIVVQKILHRCLSEAGGRWVLYGS
jgi:hypothetical protein